MAYFNELNDEVRQQIRDKLRDKVADVVGDWIRENNYDLSTRDWLKRTEKAVIRLDRGDKR